MTEPEAVSDPLPRVRHFCTLQEATQFLKETGGGNWQLNTVKKYSNRSQLHVYECSSRNSSSIKCYAFCNIILHPDGSATFFRYKLEHGCQRQETEHPLSNDVKRKIQYHLKKSDSENPKQYLHFIKKAGFEIFPEQETALTTVLYRRLRQKKRGSRKFHRL